MRAAGSGVGRGDRDLDEFAGYRFRAEATHAAARIHVLEEGTPSLLRVPDTRGGVRDESRGRGILAHAASLPPVSTSAMPFFMSTRERRMPPMMKKTTRARIATR